MTYQDFWQYLIYIAIGLTIGSISGMLGIGGGVLIVPALMWLCGFEAKKAAGTSLAILIPPIGLPAAWRFYQQQADRSARRPLDRCRLHGQRLPRPGPVRFHFQVH